jgi:hypothetical protein
MNQVSSKSSALPTPNRIRLLLYHRKRHWRKLFYDVFQFTTFFMKISQEGSFPCLRTILNQRGNTWCPENSSRELKKKVPGHTGKENHFVPQFVRMGGCLSVLFMCVTFFSSRIPIPHHETPGNPDHSHHPGGGGRMHDG